MRLIIFFLFGSLFFISCGDDEIPTCVDERLTSFRTEACESTATADGGNLVRFRFRSETVYCFNWGPCQPNKTVEIWQEDCGLLCELNGPDALTSCDGTDWASTAVEEEVIFQR